MEGREFTETWVERASSTNFWKFVPTFTADRKSDSGEMRRPLVLQQPSLGPKFSCGFLLEEEEPQRSLPSRQCYGVAVAN